MAEQAGSAAAFAANQAALATQQRAAADADRALAEVLTNAHAATVAGMRRLDVLAGEIDHAAAGFALDTPLGAREFQKFLITKQRDVLAVVAATQELDDAARVRVESLRAAYSAPRRG